MRIVFMGTPDFAVGSLMALAECGKHEIVGVVTQPDRPKGRGNKMLMTPVKEYALSKGYEVHQPQKVKTPEFVQILRDMQPDLIVVAAFGQFLSQEILSMPKYGCINVHASLLPKYRGAAPIQYAIIKGERESGVTIMQMDIGMDTGAMLDKVVEELIAGGYEPDTPIAIVQRASWPEEKIVRATLETICEEIADKGIDRTAMIVVSRCLAADYELSRLYAPEFSHMFREASK